MKTFFTYLRPRRTVRERVTDQLDPYIYIPLVWLPWSRSAGGRQHPGSCELRLSVVQALELQGLLTKEIQDRCKRADIRQALDRTDPQPLIDIICSPR